MSKKQKTREERAGNYTNGDGGMGPLLWGRLKLLHRYLENQEPNDEDLADVAAALYLMDYSKLRALTPANFLEGCERFAAKLPAQQVVDCGLALQRDMAAIEASDFEPAEKTEEAEEEPSPSPSPA